jgi:hypothetical protein
MPPNILEEKHRTFSVPEAVLRTPNTPDHASGFLFVLLAAIRAGGE